MQSRMAFGKAILVALACLIVPCRLAASAQSSIVGLVRDESGGVLPGVTVEAASPVLIEKVRTGVTDAQGRYRLVDLRPGTYTRDLHADRVQHGRAGRRGTAGELHGDGQRGPEGGVAAGNGDGVGGDAGGRRAAGVEDAGADPGPGRHAADDAEHLVDWDPGAGGPDGEPRTWAARGRWSRPGMRAHGISERNVTQLRRRDDDQQQGEQRRRACVLGRGAAQETSVMTSAIPADTLAGGDAASTSFRRTAATSSAGRCSWAAATGRGSPSNVDDELRARGIERRATASRTSRTSTATMGGPVHAGQALVLHVDAAHLGRTRRSPTCPRRSSLPDGTMLRGIPDQFVRDVAVRLTWQVNSRNKVGGHVRADLEAAGQGLRRTGRIRGRRQQRDPKQGAVTGRGRRSGPRRSAASCCSRAATRPTSCTSPQWPQPGQSGPRAVIAGVVRVHPGRPTPR